MKISYNWLKDYLDINISPQQLEDKLTFAGIEVESVEKLGEELNQIKVAKILECKDHPGSDHLSICQVDDGKETVQVICGAPNCATDQKIAFAPVGTQIGDFKIKKAKLRGEVSFGMICSEQELGISENHDGIMILPDSAPIGETLASFLKMEDTIFDVEITPNRPDLLGMIGVAKDLSALLHLPIKLPEVKIMESDEPIEDSLKLQNLAPDLCTRYTARMIKGVTIKESPNWLKERLVSVGLRPINNIVDVTNFVMMEYGHPLHAFDYHLLGNKEIIVRKAKSGEKFPALDEETYTLNDSDLVIADSNKPVALAGIIGGENSHITDTTRDIVLEAANFLYSSIRKSAGRLNISTDSSYRFERDISDETAEIVSQRAAALILKVAGGKLLNGKLDSFPNPKGEVIVGVRPSRVKKLLTIDVTNQKLINYLEALGLKLNSEEDDLLQFIIPAYRKDLSREIDLIEEIIRLHGYNNVDTLLKTQSVMNREVFYARRKIADILTANGFSEVLNWNFGDPEDLDKLKISVNDERRNFAELINPLGSRFSIMRPILLPQILKNALHNLNHGQKNLKLFEMAKTFTRADQKLASERLHVSGILTGALNSVYWKEKSANINFFDVKGIMEEILEELRISKAKFTESDESF
ncbi:MAG: phenylalanine--tRNA ligase subunit beta, partial [Candidatus Cloacimonadota bacterium]